MKNIRVFFYLKHFQLLEVKFSIYLNRCVFVMLLISSSLGASGELCVVVMGSPGYRHSCFYMCMSNIKIKMLIICRTKCKTKTYMYIVPVCSEPVGVTLGNLCID